MSLSSSQSFLVTVLTLLLQLLILLLHPATTILIINDSLAFEISLIRFINLIYSDCKLPFLCSWGNDLMNLSKDSHYTLPIATFTLICIPSSCLLLIVYKVLLFANLSYLALHLCYFH